MMFDTSNWLTPEEIQFRLDHFNAFNDWTIFNDVPDSQSISVMYPSYGFGYRAAEVAAIKEKYGPVHS